VTSTTPASIGVQNRSDTLDAGAASARRALRGGLLGQASPSPHLSALARTLLTRTSESWCIFSTYPSRNDMTTETGTVKWFNEGKGFGFIAPDSGGKDLFAHFKEIIGTGFKVLTENQRVEFEVIQGQKGPQAARIKPI